jgi:hypothetical protein
MALRRTRRMTSPGARISGSGTVSQLRDSTAWKVMAFIVVTHGPRAGGKMSSGEPSSGGL